MGTETQTQTGFKLTPETILAIEEIIHRRNQAEIKIEHGQIAVIEIRRKKVN